MADVLGAVLVGGESRRMGCDKSRLRLGRVALAERAVTVLRECFPDVVLVGDERRCGPVAGVRRLADSWPGEGPLAGLHAALGVSADGVFVLACDLPFVDSATVREVAAALEDDDDAAIAVSRESRQPLCGRYRRSCLEAIEVLRRDGRRSMNALLESIRVREVAVGQRDGAAGIDPLMNVNRPDEYRAAVEAWERG